MRLLRRVKEVWNNVDGTTIFDLKTSPCRSYPFELYFNIFLMCAWLCFYFLLLFLKCSIVYCLLKHLVKKH